jgi:hypothetical protein
MRLHPAPAGRRTSAPKPHPRAAPGTHSGPGGYRAVQADRLGAGGGRAVRWCRVHGACTGSRKRARRRPGPRGQVPADRRSTQTSKEAVMVATVELTRFTVMQGKTEALLAARPAMLADFRADRTGFLDARLVRLPGEAWLDICSGARRRIGGLAGQGRQPAGHRRVLRRHRRTPQQRGRRPGRPGRPVMRAAFYDRQGPARQVLQVGEVPTPGRVPARSECGWRSRGSTRATWASGGAGGAPPWPSPG